MKIKVNGIECAVAEGLILLRLLEERSLNPKAVVVELNAVVVETDFSEVVLHEGDSLEILHFVGGG